MRLAFVIFFLIFITVYGSAHWPLHHLMTRTFALASPWTHWVKAVFALSGSLFFLVRFTPLDWKPLAWWADTWFGVVFIAFTFWLVQVIPALIWKPHARAFDAMALAITALVSVISLAHNVLPPRPKSIHLAIPGAPSMKVVQLSDIHLNRWTSMTGLERVVENTLAANPDLIVITGDLVDERDGSLDFLLPSLQRLRAPLGVYAIPGNHEFYTGIQRAADLLQKAGIRFLRNESVGLPNGWILAGLDDPAAYEMGLAASKPEEFFKALPKGKPIVLMNHRPLDWESARRAGVKLQLSGHLHAGQIPPMDAIVFAGFKYPYGLYQKDGDFLYTTSGTGFWGPPMRFIVGAEIPVFNINKRES
jgi:hypothetical protein